MMQHRPSLATKEPLTAAGRQATHLPSARIIREVLLILCDTPWMKAHLVRGWQMTEANVTVEYFGTTMGRGWDGQGLRQHRERNARWRNVASQIAANRGLDLVFLVAYDDVLEDESFIHFKKLGAKLVLYHVDMLPQWYRIIRAAKFIDLLCYASSDHIRYFEKRGVQLFNFAFAAIPSAAEEICSPPLSFDGVLYTGSPWPYRQRILHTIAAAGVPLRIYGHSWSRKGTWPKTPGSWRKTLHDLRWYLLPRLREENPGAMALHLLSNVKQSFARAAQTELFPAGIIQDTYQADQFVPLVRGAAVNLGFTQMALRSAQEFPRQIRLRDFEVPMAGGFYLAQNCAELGNYFEIGREIAVWDTAQDVVECCRYYLNRPQERAQIAEAGYLRALRNHTWLKRFSAMAARLGFRLPIEMR